MSELMKVKDIQERLAIGRSATYALIHDPSFPKPIVINQRILRWEIGDFENWLNERKKQLKPTKQKQVKPNSRTILVNGVLFRKGEL
jgi:predicted DNA-binding transcriptional regulator AlpA